jgi:crotonobetainyl-CoA:carnitine CoA-transferase CaiB-like acyl-CoA transferase
VFASRTVREWLDVLVTAGVPAAKVNTVLEALAEPQTEARGDVVEHDHPTLGTVRTIRTALRLEAGGEALERAPARGPFRGEHTDEVLAGLCGYAPERIRALREAGVFGESEVPA